jgi:hypothetical protein
VETTIPLPCLPLSRSSTFSSGEALVAEPLTREIGSPSGSMSFSVTCATTLRPGLTSIWSRLATGAWFCVALGATPMRTRAVAVLP